MEFIHPHLKEYTYIETLGQGAQAKVVKVKDFSGRRVYALKLFHSLASSGLEQEAKALEQLNHSNIVGIFDSSLGSEEKYILMQYMKHGNIRTYLAKNELSIYDKLLLIGDVAKAISYIHKKEFIHRDIKPKNIFITDDGELPYACLGDFGIVKKIETETDTEGGKGTDMYLPLEVLLGEERHSKGSDIYGLGMSMYEILSGKRPVNNFTKYVQELSNPDPFLAPSYYNKTLGNEIDELCLRAIAKKKEERFETIEEFYEQLSYCISLYNNELNSDREQEEDAQNVIDVKNKYYEDVVGMPLLETGKNDIIENSSNIKEISTPGVKAALITGDLAVETDSMSAEDLYSMGQNYFLGLNNQTQNEKKGIEYYEKAAEKGSRFAMYDLGVMYESGRGVEQDYAEAVKWYRKAAGLGDSNGMFTLGNMYYYGRGVEQDDSEAVKWFEKSAELGDSIGMFNLGVMYEDGRGVEQDDSEAVKWYRKAAEGEYSSGMFNLGVMYAYGRGVEQNYVEAVKWYRKSAELGESKGMFNLGVMYVNGLGVEQSYVEAVKWYRKSAEGGNSNGMSNLGLMYEFGRGVEQDYVEAVKWYRMSAEGGNSDGMFKLAEMYATGRGVEQDYVEAVKWVEKSAEAGNSSGMFQLGWMYSHGRGVARNYIKAVKWFEKSAEAGHSNGMVTLGNMYYHGRGVEQNNGEAAKWFERSAEAGNEEAMYKLGRMYYYGRGVEKDHVKAVKWYRKSAEAGHKDGMFNLGNMYYHGRGVKKSSVEANKWYRMAAEARKSKGMLKQ